MSTDKELYKEISEIASNSVDPERAKRNILRFIDLNEFRRFTPYLNTMIKLFATSQFLANYCIANPDELYIALKERKNNITRELLKERADKELFVRNEDDIKDMMRCLRLFKKRYLLRTTLRYVTGETDILISMDELTFLAETILSVALQWSLRYNQQRFGEPSDSVMALIALGKLGGEELNYSSDVDLIAVYDGEDGQTSGILTPSGIVTNRISNHEFYCKVVEFVGKLLSSQTDDGIAYRVDFRLRPQGQRGDIVLPLRAYQTYYESWGRTWERMVLIRARPIAGDINLGKTFLEKIKPFVWRRTLDYAEIEEIRNLKKKIDSTLARDDIKRGYGGIREAEFFVHTFQLLYGSENESLKTWRILDAIQTLKLMKIVPEEDLTALRENYLYLRCVEHYLQMKEDLQTHTLPSSDEALNALAKQMGFQSKDHFLANLRLRRMQIKNMYNSLLGTKEEVHAEALNLLEGNLTDEELSGYLSFRKVKYPNRCLANMKSIREHMGSLQTLQERSIAREVIPQLLENALIAESPDRALAGLDKILTTYGIKTAHLMAFREQRELMAGIIKIFSLSPYLTRIFLSSQHYLDILIEEWAILKTLKAMEERLRRALKRGEDFESILAEFKRFEEVRLGLLFLSNILRAEDLFRGLSYVAEVIIKTIIEKFECMELAVIGLGKLGSREMTFGSDIDIIFVSKTHKEMKSAEKVMKTLTAYTDMGLLYDVDTRLRPDGSKGILVKNIEGYKNYYLDHAQSWEIQALLRARPIGGEESLARSFIDMAKAVILQKGRMIKKHDILAMRDRIIRELSLESKGIDIKLGPGSMEEIEFYVQFLQLQYAEKAPDILVQNTLSAINRLAKKGILSSEHRDTLYNAYEYFRKLQTFLRLNEEIAIVEDSDIIELSAKFMDHKSPEDFLSYVENLRYRVLAVIQKV
jgi:glutamate-ammonia-ligase adenylyltransferase